MDQDIPPLLINFSLVIIGLALGSFATALAHRVPLKKSVGGVSRSACPHCNHVLGFADLVPVFSWLVSAGKCRYCAREIGMTYPLIELGVMLTCFLTYWAQGWSHDTVFIIAAIPFLAALLVIDLRYMILPNMLLVVLGAIGLMRMLFKAVILKDAPDFHMITEYFIDVAFFAGISWSIGFFMEKILKKPALGMGDVKFFAMAGLWLGLSQLGWFCGLSGFLGVLFASIFRNYTKDSHFPFGPSLITALFLLLLTDGSLLP